MLRILNNPLKLLSCACSKLYMPYTTAVSTSPEIHQPQELDKLYKTLVVEVRGHDRAVLNSYEWFAKTAAKYLDINIANILEPREHRHRRTLLKSVFIYKKHRVQYEFRTYYRIFEIKHITSSSADTYLEYIQRNLPEGVSMRATKHQIEKLPEHIANYVPEKKEESTVGSKSS